MDNEKKIQELLEEITKKEEKYNKNMMLAMWTIMITALVAFLFVTILITTFLPEGSLQLVIILVATALFLVACFIALKFEVDAGYYKCRNCKHKFKASYKQVLCSKHMGTTRRLKCPECDKKTWCKKVLK